METERADQLKACDIEIKFMAFKPPMNMPLGHVVPRRMYFTFQLFTFQTTKTDLGELEIGERNKTEDGNLLPGV